MAQTVRICIGNFGQKGRSKGTGDRRRTYSAARARHCVVLYCAAASEMVEGACVPSYCVLLYPHNDLPHLLTPTSNCRGCFAHDGDGQKRRLSMFPRTEKGRQNSVPLNFLCWGWVSPYMQDGRCVHALASCTVSPFVLQRGATQLMGGEK
jgi:hypothetical protein